MPATAATDARFAAWMRAELGIDGARFGARLSGGNANVTQLVEMDGRVLVPFRGEFFVLEGKNNLGDDTLKSAPSPQEELPLEI